MMKVALISLGCAKNLVDSEGLLGRLADTGDMDLTQDPEDADGVIINTCGFLQAAREESEDVTAEMVRLLRGGRLSWVAMAGCLVERYGPELSKKFPDVTFLGFKDYENVETLVRRARDGDLNPPPPPSKRRPREHQGIHGSRLLLTQQSFAYLRISEGCSLRCSFCVIPDIRGEYRSRNPEDLVAEAEALALAGVNELVLVSQDTTYFGHDQKNNEFLLPQLLEQLRHVEGIEWIRLHYLNPAFTSGRLLRAMAEIPEVVPYLDMPVQHAADTVLRRMKRTPGVAGIRKVIDEARQRIPDLTLRTTVMVGFPGETRAEFQALLDFLQDVRFDRLGCFTFSPEPGTPAVELPDPVPEDVKEERRHRVMELQEGLTRSSHDRKVGTIQDIMVDITVDIPGLEVQDLEGPDPEMKIQGEGRTPGDAPEVDCKVYLQGEGWVCGGPVPARITARQDFDLIACPLEEP